MGNLIVWKVPFFNRESPSWYWEVHLLYSWESNYLTSGMYFAIFENGYQTSWRAGALEVLDTPFKFLEVIKMLMLLENASWLQNILEFVFWYNSEQGCRCPCNLQLFVWIVDCDWPVDMILVLCILMPTFDRHLVISCESKEPNKA